MTWQNGHKCYKTMKSRQKFNTNKRRLGEEISSLFVVREHCGISSCLATIHIPTSRSAADCRMTVYTTSQVISARWNNYY